MKLYILLILLFTFGCQNKIKSRWEIINAERNAEIKKGISKDTILLGFIFGMSSEQVNNRFNQLVSENKIQTNSKNEYEYNVPIDFPKNIKATFSNKFLNDSLYSLSMRIESDSPTTSALIHIKLTSLLYKKYSKYTKLLKVPAILNEKNSDYIFITGNQQIEISNPFPDLVIVEYYDYVLQNRKNLMDNIDQKNKENKAIRDL